MLRSVQGLLWGFAAGVSLAMPGKADVIESTPIAAFSPNNAQAHDEPVPVPEAPNTGDEPAGTDKTGEAEVIQERYPNRAVKVERHIVQDASGNFVNHGKWTMFDEKGRMLGCGMYRYGERHGVWTRWHLTPGEKDMLSQTPYKLFRPPFVSEANFDCGKINGTWAIYDSQDRKVSEFTFEQGERQGKSIWYYPTGEKMREIDFTGGQLDGQWQEWGPGRKLTMSETYQNGRRLAKKVETHSGGQPKSESMCLFAREVLKNNYDWWNGSVTTTTAKEGKDQRHGLYISWHKNGQKDQEGQYLNDLPVGKFSWWYANGQKAIEGQFVNGERGGLWTWWHENGQKSVCGEFVKGTEIGQWTWWKEDGKVANAARITEGQTKSSLDADFPGAPAMAANPAAPQSKPMARQARGTRRVTAPTSIRR